MNYDLKKAVDRFQFRFTKDDKGNFKTFKPNIDDVNAINEIFGWIGRQKKENVLNNNVMAKLYIYVKTMNIRHYETTVLDTYNIPNEKMINLLKTPLHVFFKAFHKDLQDNQLNKLVKTEDKEDQNEIWKQYIELQKSFTLENVSSKLEDEISEVLNKFSDPKLTDFKNSDFGL